MSKTCLMLTGSIVFEMGRQTHSNKIKANKKGGIKNPLGMLSSSPITSISQFIFSIFYYKSSHGLIKRGGGRQPLLIHFLHLYLIKKSLLRQKSGKGGG